jgi:hypothetical protein
MKIRVRIHIVFPLQVQLVAMNLSSIKSGALDAASRSDL